MNKTDLSFRTYVNEVAEPKLKKDIRSVAIFGYVLAGFNLILAVIFNIFMLIDVVLIGGLTFGFHFGKSRVCSVLLFIYSIYNCIYMTLKTGSFSGYLIIIMAFGALKEFYNANKEYKSYIKNTHTIDGESVNKQ